MSIQVQHLNEMIKMCHDIKNKEVALKVVEMLQDERNRLIRA